ncbi:MAG: sigma-70 family RNA polymerase sigma factor [Elainellaceae cyanobacterium]
MNESNDLEGQLKQLAMDAQQHPPKSRERQRSLTKLLRLIQRSGKLAKPRLGQFQTFYGEIYAEAQQRLFLFVCDRIDDYSPARGEVLQWINFLMTRRFFIEASRDFMPTLPKGLDPKLVRRLSIDELDRHNPNEVNPHLVPLPTQQILQCLEEDPEGLFAGCHVVGWPNATFQVIAMRKLSGYTWHEISSELRININTLSSFYQRRIDQFKPKFKEYLS